MKQTLAEKFINKYPPGSVAALIMGLVIIFAGQASAWYDETHLAVAKAAGYKKWYNAAGADMVKTKAGKKEGANHFVNNTPGAFVTPRMVTRQIKKYDTQDPQGHLYGAIVASARAFIREKREGKYAHYHLAFCAHYVGDLSQPLHNIAFTSYNETWHRKTDGIVNNEILTHPEKIRIYPIVVHTEADLVNEIARIANLSIEMAGRLESETRVISQKEAYEMLGHSASLLKAILHYVGESGNASP
jgi:hypothetical protein